MRKIKIFVAGSKELVQERNYIKILANDLNSAYNDSDVVLTIHSYEHFNDKQIEYNNFIENESDLVIFILDDHIGGKTEEEFLKATYALEKSNRPEVIVFLHKFTELTPEIARIQGLITGRLGDRYYVEYSSLDDLKAKARERIIRYIENSKGVSVRPSASRTKDNQPQRAKSLLIAMSSVIIALAVVLGWVLMRPVETLIFAGGGSVKNFIEKTQGIDLIEYPNSVYANLASGSAWSLLAEEANRYQEDGGRGQERFSSICLSADEIDSTFINEKTRGMFANARIIQYNLGEDPLVIYVHNKILRDFQIESHSRQISVDSLRLLIKYALNRPEQIRIFTTSKTSGTLRLYQSCFTSKDSINFEELLSSGKTHLYYIKSTSAHINALDVPNANRPYIILGSQYYYPQTIESEKEARYTALYVTDGHITVSKPMNIYFVGQYIAAGADYCIIKRPVIQFLKDIHANERMDDATWGEVISGHKKTSGGDLILKLN